MNLPEKEVTKVPKAMVNGINIYYEIHGEGEPLVLICGLGADLSSWAMQLAEFSQKYKVIVFDNRGVGRTDAPDAPYSTAMMADDVVGLMDAIGIDKAHILGSSMGGFIAQELALKYPQRVKSLILASTGAQETNIGKHLIATWVRMAREGVSLETRMREELLWIMSNNFFALPALVDGMVSYFVANPYPQSVHGLAHQTTACLEHNTAGRIGQITAPTLVIVGREDILLPVRISEELVTEIPHAKLVVIDGGAHAVNGEVPDKFNKAVLGFLSDVCKQECSPAK